LSLPRPLQAGPMPGLFFLGLAPRA